MRREICRRVGRVEEGSRGERIGRKRMREDEGGFAGKEGGRKERGKGRRRVELSSRTVGERENG